MLNGPPQVPPKAKVEQHFTWGRKQQIGNVTGTVGVYEYANRTASWKWSMKTLKQVTRVWLFVAEMGRLTDLKQDLSQVTPVTLNVT